MRRAPNSGMRTAHPNTEASHIASMLNNHMVVRAMLGVAAPCDCCITTRCAPRQTTSELGGLCAQEE